MDLWPIVVCIWLGVLAGRGVYWLLRPVPAAPPVVEVRLIIEEQRPVRARSVPPTVVPDASTRGRRIDLEG